MVRDRTHSRSYSPRRVSRSPPRRRKRYDDPRDRFYRERRSSPPPSGLLIRNISLDARPEDLRIPFERFGPVKDVYLPKNYYTGEPRGFGFVKFRNADDAAEAKQQMNHQVIGGREVTIVFAEENRKTPQEMRSSARISGGRYMGGGYRKRSPPRSPRRRYRSYSRSLSPPRHGSRTRDRHARDDYYSRSSSRAISPSPRHERDYYYSRSPSRSISPSPRDERDYRFDWKSSSPRGNSRSPSRSRSYSR